MEGGRLRAPGAWRRCRPPRAATGGEDGFVAGGESLALGVLVFVVGTLLVLSGWTLVDSKLAVEAAAREAVRAVVEAPVEVLGSAEVQTLARSTAEAAVAAHRGSQDAPDAVWSLVDVELAATRVERCAPVRARVAIDVETVRLPLIGGGFGTVTLYGEHTERFEPYRSGLPAGIDCG